MREDIAVIQAAKKLGYDPARMTERQYRNAALMAQKGLKNKASAVVSATTSLLKTTVLSLRVLPETVKENKRVCSSCEHFSTLADGAPVCRKCTCSGKFLISKWNDPDQECPIEDPTTSQPKWSNKGKPTVKNHNPDLTIQTREQVTLPIESDGMVESTEARRTAEDA